jgi:putative peptide zinc metalloprotease protein
VADNLFSPSWYRVANLKPRMRMHTTIYRHEYRGKVWHILQDPAGGRSHRFTPAAYRFIGLMDGKRTVEELWQNLHTQAGDDAPTQDEVIRMLGQLHAADALICDVPPDSLEVFRRFQRNERMRWKQRIWTPLAIRIPLIDPDRFLDRTLPYVKWIFSVYGAVAWVMIVGIAAILVGVYWSELTDNIVDRALTPGNLIVLWFVYPVVKALHELGHGYAIKKFGGEVHEMGIMFLVLVPVPYVDATAASGFRQKHQRMLVGAAGILVELFFGALALFVWLSVESGTVHAVAYNVMLISGVSTILFNGNPLLRFDGYYVLADALEIPNLGTRSNKYLGYLIQRYVFKMKDAESPANVTGERVWFVLYGIAAFIYRIFIMFAIILYIGTRFFAVGVLLAMWSFTTMVVVPVSKQLKFLFTSPKLRRNRGRSVGLSALTLIVVLGILFVLPAPFWTRTEGVTWPAESSQVRASVDGFIVRLAVPAGSEVRKGQEIIVTRDAFMDARVQLLEANKKELENQLRAARTVDRVRTEVIREALAAADAALDLAKVKMADLVIYSPRDGILVVPQEQDLPDRFVRQGQLLGYVIQPSDPVTLRVAVSQDEIGLVREEVRGVSVMPAQWGAGSFPAVVRREVPGGTTQLPTAALGLAGGGRFAVDPRDSSGRATLERVFELEVDLPAEVETDYLGRRMYVRLDHGYKAAGLQMYMALRQLFLRQFGV